MWFEDGLANKCSEVRVCKSKGLFLDERKDKGCHIVSLNQIKSEVKFLLVLGG